MAPQETFLLLLFFATFATISSGSLRTIRSDRTPRMEVTENATIGQEYINTTRVSLEYHYIYHLESSFTQAFRLRTETASAKAEHPLRVTVRYDKGTTNWDVPYTTDRMNFTKVERTLCLSGEKNHIEKVTVIVSTSSKANVTFKLMLFKVDDFDTFVNSTEMKIVSNVTVATPVFHYVDLSQAEEDTLLQVHVTSSQEKICAIVSVQPMKCPISDLDSSIRIEGSTYQTMLSTSSFNIVKDDEMGKFIVFLVLPDDSACLSHDEYDPNQMRIKTFEYRISDQVSKKKILLEVSISLAIMILLGICVLIASCLYSIYEDKDLEKKIWKLRQQQTACQNGVIHETSLSTTNPNDASELGCPGRYSQNLEFDAPDSGVRQENQRRTISESRRTTSETEDEMQQEQPSKRLPKYVSELATRGRIDRQQRKIYKSMFHKSDLYIWLVLMMGIFYGIPAIQLVINYQEKLVTSGNQDICYFNFLCSVPIGKVNDFNHIFSNIGYLGFGMLFVFLTWYKKRKHLKIIERLKDEENGNDYDMEFGVPQHFGIYFAMGFALIFEGILSACYHVCPTNENFQFDTTFMYVIAVLCFLKIYQFRHPDATSNAYKVFFGVGLIMFLEVMGIFNENAVFWTICLILYLLVCLVITSIIYHSGLWSLDFLVFFKIYQSVTRLAKTRECSENYSGKRLGLCLSLNALNLGLIIYGAFVQPGISTYLLMIFIANLLVYALYYTAMKLVHKEKIRPMPILYSVLAVVCWLPSFYFFATVQKDTNTTPSDSRNLNGDCLILDLYDYHDVWHFLSSAGLFFSFLFMLSLDDGLFYTPRNKIHIF